MCLFLLCFSLTCHLKKKKIPSKYTLMYALPSCILHRRSRWVPTVTWSSVGSAWEWLSTRSSSFLRPKTKLSWRSVRCLPPTTTSTRKSWRPTVIWTWPWWTAMEPSGSIRDVAESLLEVRQHATSCDNWCPHKLTPSLFPVWKVNLKSICSWCSSCGKELTWFFTPNLPLVPPAIDSYVT